MGMEFFSPHLKKSKTISEIEPSKENIPRNIQIENEYSSSDKGKKSKYNVKYSNIKQIFFFNASKYPNSQEYCISKEKFSDFLSQIFNFDIPIICHTHLTEKLFNLIKTSEGNAIFLHELLEGMKYLLLSPEAKVKVSFDIMKRDPTISELFFKDLVEYFMKSWKQGFYLLTGILRRPNCSDIVKAGIPIPEYGELDYLLQKNEENVREYLKTGLMWSFEQCLSGYFTRTFPDNFVIPYPVFKRWICNDHDLEITYYNKRIKIAMSLMCLQGIDLIMNEM